jgi:hypothetical protein
VDDYRVRQLETDVRALQLLVEQQARRIDALQAAIGQSRTGRPSLPSQVAAKAPSGALWLQRANWDKLRNGMSEADVMRLLGPPTTVRKPENGGAQTLFYSMELDAGGFLSGNVVIGDQQVLEIHAPALK